MGHPVLLIPPQHVKAFRRVHKSDAHDALAIAEAEQRPELHPVPVKSPSQQDLQLVGPARELLMTQRTAVVNQLRGMAAEYGVEFPATLYRLRQAAPAILADECTPLTSVARQVLAGLLEQLRALDTRIDTVTAALTELAKTEPAYARLLTIPGFGPIVIAAFLAAVGKGQQFKSGRHLAAWLGRVPRQHGTGGQVHLHGITKNGDRSLRTLLVHGARALMVWADKHTHAQSQWLRQLQARRGKNRTVVALANKLARVAWAVLRTDTDFIRERAFKPLRTA
jgi:transposase